MIDAVGSDAAGGPPRVLVVDDDAELLRVYRQILDPPRSASEDIAALLESQTDASPAVELEVTLVADGRDGERHARKALAAGRPFVLAFVDMRMPGGWDGLRTAQTLRAVDPRIYLVIATAYSDEDVDQLNRVLHRDLVLLRKPFAHDEVLQLARTLTRGWQIQNQRDHLLLRLEEAVLERTAALKMRLMRERALAQVAERMMDLRDDEQPADAIIGALAHIGGSLDLDRALLMQLDARTADSIGDWCWSAFGVDGEPLLRLPALDPSTRAALIDRCRRGISFVSGLPEWPAERPHAGSAEPPRVLDALPREGAPDRRLQLAQVLGIPAISGGSLRGLLLAERARGLGDCSEEDVSLLSAVAHILMRAIEQQDLRLTTRLAAERHEAAQRHARLGYFELDPAGALMTLSRSIAQMAQLPADVPIPLGELLRRVHSADRKRIRGVISEMSTDDRTCSAVFRARAPDGGWLRLECVGGRMLAGDGRYAVVGTIRDVGRTP